MIISKATIGKDKRFWRINIPDTDLVNTEALSLSELIKELGLYDSIKGSLENEDEMYTFENIYWAPTLKAKVATMLQQRIGDTFEYAANAGEHDFRMFTLGSEFQVLAHQVYPGTWDIPTEDSYNFDNNIYIILKGDKRYIEADKKDTYNYLKMVDKYNAAIRLASKA